MCRERQVWLRRVELVVKVKERKWNGRETCEELLLWVETGGGRVYCNDSGGERLETLLDDGVAGVSGGFQVCLYGHTGRGGVFAISLSHRQ
jgi:hypothetical protein